jgi:hypothetical protein
MQRALGLLIAASALLVTSRAHAYYPLPNEIVSHLNITCANPIWDGQGCLLCHESLSGGCTTATHPFGQWLVSQGLTCANGTVLDAPSLDPYLDEAKAEAIDTNCDGVPDVTQLTTCNWQALSENKCGDAGNTPEISENVIHGCSMVDGSSAPGMLAFGVAGALAGLLIRRCSRRPASGGSALS